ncbi:MAG: hypothetical protein JHC87_08630 [Thermoleophilaceae bacterium]|nr:hypothetical protein [Thermoleophilaceae bacterium]
MTNILKWGAVGIAGLALAVGLSLFALQLTNQQIGISSEPLGAGRLLAPPDIRKAESDEQKERREHQQRATNPPPKPPASSGGPVSTPSDGTPSHGAPVDSDEDNDDD